MMWGKEWDEIPGARKRPPTDPWSDYYYVSELYKKQDGGGIKWNKWHYPEGSPEHKEFLESFERFAKLVDAGIRAVRKVSDETGKKIDVEVHCAFNVVEGEGVDQVPLPESEKFPKVKEFITQLTTRLASKGSKIDRLGISYYPEWHGSWSELQRNMIEIMKLVPGLQLNIAECSPSNSASSINHPEPGFVPSVQSQGDDTAELMKIVNDVPDNLGQGVWSWAGSGVHFTAAPGYPPEFIWVADPSSPWGWSQVPNPDFRGAFNVPYASMKVYKDAFPEASGIVKNIFITAKPGVVELPKTVAAYVKNASGWESIDVEVKWADNPVSSSGEMPLRAVPGTVSINGKELTVTAYLTVAREAPSYPEGFVPGALDDVDNEAKTDVKPKIEVGDEIATATVDAYYLHEAVIGAIADADKAKAEGQNVAAVVEINAVPEDENVTETEVKLPNNGLKDVLSVDLLRIVTKSATISMSNRAVSEILTQAGARDVTFASSEKPVLNEKQQDAVGEAPVFEVTVKAGIDEITDFKNAPITIQLPYTLKQGETAKGVEVYHVEDDGSLVAMNAAYDEGIATFQTSHLSLFMIKHTGDNSGDNGYDSGGGCDTGLGFAGILAIAFVGVNALRRREK
jgi:hypothetical protein